MADINEADTKRTTLTDFIPILESIMRISLSGFGGAMAGLSLSRRSAAAAALSSRTAAAAASSAKRKKHTIHRHHPTSLRSSSLSVSPHAADRELPAAWAMACMAFTGVVEFTTFVSPSRVASDYWYSSNETMTDNDSIAEEGGDNRQSEPVKPIEDASKNGPSEMMSQLSQYCSNLFCKLSTTLSSLTTTTTTINTESIQTIADYAIGGSLGGALFTGSAIRTRSGKKFDAALLGGSTSAARGGPMRGLLPGATLGLLAGSVLVVADRAREYLEEEFGRDEEIMTEEAIAENDGLEETNKEKEDGSQAGMVVPEHIKAMTNEELAKAIKDLKR